MDVGSVLDKLADPSGFQVRQAAKQQDFCEVPIFIPILGDTNILC